MPQILLGTSLERYRQSEGFDGDNAVDNGLMSIYARKFKLEWNRLNFAMVVHLNAVRHSAGDAPRFINTIYPNL
jgi:hypothetical protein